MEAQSSQLIPDTELCCDTPVRLLLDGRKLGDGGIGVYIENLVNGLLSVGGVEITILTTKDKADRTSFAGDVSWIFDSARPYSLDELILLPRRIRFDRFDIFHTPHYMLPFRIPIPTVVTIHDVIHMTHPERFFYPFIAKPLISSAVSRASSVIAVSQDTRSELIARFKAPPGKIRHIPNSVSTATSQVARTSRSSVVTDSAPFFLAVLSNLKPHKGVKDLLTAYERCYERLQRKGQNVTCPRLVLAGYGAESLLGQPELLALVDQMKGVRVVGALDREDLACLYERAHAVVVASMAEGFCLPALEAQSRGTPVVCRPIAVLEELVTERDIVASDLSPQALESALILAASRPRGDREAIAAHLDRFAIDTVARQVSSLYREVLGWEGAR